MIYKTKSYYLKNKNLRFVTFRSPKKLKKLIKVAKTGKYSAPNLAKIFECNKKTILNTLYYNGIILPNLGWYKKRIQCDEEFFNKLTPLSTYWIGFIAADGCLFNNRNQKFLSIRLAKLDKKHLIKFKKAIKTNAKISYIKTNNSSGIVIYSEKLFNSLTKLGIRPNKTFSMTKIKIPYHLISHFIRGVFDGDGSISGSKVTHIQFCIVGNKYFLKWIQNFLIKECKLNKVRLYPMKGKSFRLQYTGIQIFRVLDFLYKDSNRNMRLDRKYDKYCKFKNNFAFGRGIT